MDTYPYINSVRARIAKTAGKLVRPGDTIPYAKRVQTVYWECLSKKGRERVKQRLHKQRRRHTEEIYKEESSGEDLPPEKASCLLEQQYYYIGTPKTDPELTQNSPRGVQTLLKKPRAIPGCSRDWGSENANLIYKSVEQNNRSRQRRAKKPPEIVSKYQPEGRRISQNDSAPIMLINKERELTTWEVQLEVQGRTSKGAGGSNLRKEAAGSRRSAQKQKEHPSDPPVISPKEAGPTEF